MKGSAESEALPAAESQQILKCNAQLLFCVSFKVLRDQGGFEAVEAGGHRSMGGEEIPGTGGRQRGFEGLPCLFHEGASALQNGERRMPFVEVADLGLDSQRAQQAPSADAEQQFLLEAQLRAAAIEFAGDSAMSGVVRRIVAVEQVELHLSDLYLPGAQPDRISRQGDLQPQPLAIRLAQRRDGQLSGIVIRVERLLLSVLADGLAKVALLVEQSHGGHGHAQIAGGLELIAGHIAQTTRVDGQSLAQHKLHAEIGGASELRLGMALLKPGGCFDRLATAGEQCVDTLSKSRIA